MSLQVESLVAKSRMDSFIVLVLSVLFAVIAIVISIFLLSLGYIRFPIILPS